MIKEDRLSVSRPLLKTKGFSTLHLQIFEYILIGKTNREINRILGYTERSHAVVDHSRKVMHKLLAMEDLHKADFKERDELGFNRWTFEQDLRGREELATYKLVLLDKKWVIEGRRVFSLTLDFSRPIGTNKPWLCWDAVYNLCAKGVDPSSE